LCEKPGVPEIVGGIDTGGGEEAQSPAGAVEEFREFLA
jgi:hypothetical protein